MGSRSSRSSGGSRSSFSSGGSRSSFSSRSHSSSSSFRRSSSSSSGYHRHHHSSPIHRSYGYHHSTHLHIRLGPVGGLIFGFVFFLILSSIIIMGMSASINNIAQEVQVSHDAYYKYQDMISYAKQNPNYLVTGTIESIDYDEFYDLYYIRYSFKDASGHKQKQKTYAMYDSYDFQTKSVGEDIELALSQPHKQSSNTTDSINADFQYVELDNFAEYQTLRSELKSTNTGRLIVLIISSIIFIVFVVSFYNTIKKKNAERDNSTSTQTTTTSTDVYCAYCGSKIPQGADKCPLCGANNKK